MTSPQPLGDAVPASGVREDLGALSLSEHLSEAEFIATAHRDLWSAQELAWEGDRRVRAGAVRFARSVFEPVRALLGPLRVTSGFRCEPLNRVVGGRPLSHHALGLAADVIPLRYCASEGMEMLTRARGLGALADIDEAILEMGWIHLQAAEDGFPARHLLLQTSDGRTYRPYRPTASSEVA